VDHTGKSVIVTAGASGIGSAIALGFEKAGAGVHIVDIDDNALGRFSASNPDILATCADVANPDAVREVMEKHLESYAGIDVMVNCAGIAGPTALVEDIDFGDWARCMAVNLDATLMFCQAVIPHMRKAGRGNIINISSTAGWHGYPLRAPYVCSKWAVIGLTKTLAMELGPAGIRANVICPGSISGERMDRVIAAESRTGGVPEEKLRDIYTRGCSMKTFIDGEDIADMAVFLASDGARKVTGQVLNVDGHLESLGGLNE
jgi:NAD(P)-dependent dehydrogenase (short-subunit alcohol dehydrogenase family)